MICRSSGIQRFYIIFDVISRIEHFTVAGHSLTGPTIQSPKDKARHDIRSYLPLQLTDLLRGPFSLTSPPSTMAAATAAAATASASCLLRRSISSAFLAKRAVPSIPRTTLCYSSSASARLKPTPSLSPPVTSANDGGGGMRWESARKKRVVLRIGYVGTDYRGFARRLFNLPPGNGCRGALM
jgi:hypothetical protein